MATHREEWDVKDGDMEYHTQCDGTDQKHVSPDGKPKQALVLR